MKSAARALLKDQKENGGWAQTAEMPPDAYATGLALVALRKAGISPDSDARQYSS